jgi:hypothetical protein
MLIHNLRQLHSWRLRRGGIGLYVLWALVPLLTGCQIYTQTPAPTPTQTLEASLMDRSLLTDTPCPAPCWYSLKLGKSTKAEVIATLQALPFIDLNTIKESADYYWDQVSEKNMPAVLVSANCRATQSRCAGLVLAND